MAVPYVSPTTMSEYRQTIQLFSKNAGSLECIRSHYLPDRTGFCDLTGAKEQEDIFVLQNRAGNTMKVSAGAMQIIANIIDIKNADEWYQKLKEQKKTYRERMASDAQRKEEEKKASLRTVLVRKKSPNTLIKQNNS